jgi:hypothetical protein
VSLKQSKSVAAINVRRLEKTWYRRTAIRCSIFLNQECTPCPCATWIAARFTAPFPVFTTPHFLSSFLPFIHNNPCLYQLYMLFATPFFPPGTRYNATNTPSSCTFVLLLRVLYLLKGTALRLWYMFLLPKTSYCRNVFYFFFYSDRNMNDLRLYFCLPRFLDILLYLIVLFISVTILVSNVWILVRLKTILEHRENNKDSLLIYTGWL